MHLDATGSAEDREFDRALRPASFEEFVGQQRIRENLDVAITAARQRGEPLDHVLFSGPPGLGKTTLSHLIAAGMGTRIFVTSGPALTAPRDLIGPLTRLQRGDVFFLDEIHRMPRAVEEYLYAAMEDQAVDVVLDSGPSGRSVRIGVEPFTLVGATTREGLLSAAFRSRFGLIERLEPYPVADLVRILVAAAARLAVTIDADAAEAIATRSRGVPRVTLRLLRRMRDLAQVAGRSTIDLRTTQTGFERLGIDSVGLEDMDRRILRALIDRGAPTGIKTLAAMVEESEDTIEDVFEPHLLRHGLMIRTPQGRVATARAFEHLGLTPPSSRGPQVGELPFPD
jgi:Holliday junction DNA helicase RuvB